ncbi:MAG: ferrochelatase [Phycisphaeraceae bacterium]
MTQYDAILIVSFGGPEGLDDVMPFLENVTRGRNIPPDRLLQVAHHYEQFHGISPINQQTRDMITALRGELAAHGPDLPIYWGNRNWSPMLSDTIQRMTDDGVKHAITFVVAAYSSYSSCRQYREDVERARAAVGPDAPQVDKLRVFFNHPLFIEAYTERVADAIARLPVSLQAKAKLVFTAHSIPVSMASTSRYEAQLRESSRLIAEKLGRKDWALVYQSRSGPPTQPWLEPDVCDYLKQVKEKGEAEAVVIVPVGFLSDHMEVLYDLDMEARALCDEIKLPMARAASVGVHPKFIRMIRELIVERIEQPTVRSAIGQYPASHDACPVDCCKPPERGATGRPGPPTRPMQASG